MNKTSTIYMRWLMFRKLKKLVVCALLGSSFLYAAPSQAGLVWFSRANCINNESITWDWPGTTYWLWTNSYHQKNGVWDSGASTGWLNGFWAGAIHGGEGFSGGYYVVGDHWRWISYYGTQLLGRTYATDCNASYFFPYSN
ncbi:hypothetical protein EGT07_08070 [Herbaspirillum sp. HC18]|nr:hypothetical protein EGT07_08070 [Herbaspirillum sp. HC18]